jgi:hypothetical protein
LQRILHYIAENDIYEALHKINDVRVICAIKQSKEGVSSPPMIVLKKC